MKLRIGLSSIIIIFILLSTFLSSNIIAKPNLTNESFSENPFSTAYVEHDPIVIVSDMDFETQGWPGNGTEADPFVIDGLNITDYSTCISISNVRAVFKIQNCILTGSSNGYGISLYNTSYSTINNCIVNSKRYGFWLSTCYNCTLIGNSAIGQSYSGFHLYKSTNCTITHNVAVSSGQNTFDISDSVHISLQGNSANYSNEYGYYLDNASYTRLDDNQAWENNYGSFKLEYSNNCVMFNNSISGDSSGHGIQMDYCYESRILNNCVSNHFSSIGLFRSNYSMVVNNTVKQAYDGLVVSESGNCSVIDNVIEDSRYGLFIYKSQYCTIQRNRLEHSGFYIWSNAFSEWVHSMFENTVDGQPIGYFKNQENMIIDALHYAQLIIVNSSNVEIHNGKFENVVSAVVLAYCQDSTIWNNSASQTLDKSFMIYQSINCSVIDNAVTNASGAIHIYSSNGCSILSNRIHDNHGLAIYIEESPECTLFNNIIFNITFKGIAIDHSPECILVNNTVRYMIDPAAGTGIDLYYSENCILINNTSSDNYGHGFEIEYSGGCAITNNTAENNTDGNTEYDDDEFGFYLFYSPSCIIENNIARNNSNDGFGFIHSDDCIITGNLAEDNSAHGFDVFHSGTYSQHVIIEGNAALGNGYSGFHINDCVHTEVRNNIAEGNLHEGVELYYSEYFIVIGNIASNNSHSGFKITRGIGFVIEENKIFGNTRGVYLWDQSREGTITRNMVYENIEIGILVTSGSYNLQLFENLIGFNEISNTEDDGGVNEWDNGIDSGNYLDDYIGTGIYSIPGSAGAIDRYPQVLMPLIDSSSNITYVVGTTDHIIEWHALALYPSLYEVFLNTKQIESSNWNDSKISINVDGLEVGSYNYTLVLCDSKTNNATDSVFVTVIGDTFAPLINPFEDITLEYGTGIPTIVWSIYDDNPQSYSIFRNGVEVSYDLWNGSALEIMVDIYYLGILNYTLVVFDDYGNVANDTVFVTVVDTTFPEIIGPDSVELEEGNVDLEIVWYPFDLSPFSYLLYINDVPGFLQSWNGSEIIHPINGLEMGFYNFTIIVFDNSGNNATNTVLVTVSDVTNPTIDGPEDLSSIEGDTGIAITWTAYDIHPWKYQVYIDDKLQVQGTWHITGESITISVDRLLLGSHNITIVVIDLSGNNASDSVIVTVTQSASTTNITNTDTTIVTSTTTESTTSTTLSDDFGLSILILGLAAGIIVSIILFVVFVLPKRKGA